MDAINQQAGLKLELRKRPARVLAIRSRRRSAD